MCVKQLCALADLVPTKTTCKRLQIGNIRLHNRGKGTGLVFFIQTGSDISFMSIDNASKTTFSNHKKSLLSACLRKYACMCMHLV